MIERCQTVSITNMRVSSRPNLTHKFYALSVAVEERRAKRMALLNRSNHGNKSGHHTRIGRRRGRFETDQLGRHHAAQGTFSEVVMAFDVQTRSRMDRRSSDATIANNRLGTTRGTRRASGIPGVLAAALLATGCGGGGSGDTSSETNSPGTNGTSNANSFEINWERPQQRENGETLRASSIRRYEVGYGKESNDYEAFEQTIDTSITIKGLESGEKYYAAVRVYDFSGRISEFSEEISFVAE